MRAHLLLPLLVACTGDKAADSAAPPVEPLGLPSDPAASGVPVGVRTIERDGVTIEIWYPAPDDTAGQGGEPVDFVDFVPSSVTETLGDLSLPPVATTAVRDAAVRNTGEALPAVVFSHGFGGTRLQSIDYAEHLASRGYIVAAADHPGRMLGDVLPCLFSPPLEGCNLTGFAADPAEEHIPVLVDALDALAADGFLAGAVDMERLGMSGHSAGGGTTSTMGDAEPRFDALLSMAAPASPERSVPTLLLDGTCDGVIPTENVDEAFAGLAQGERVRILGAGHLAFSDLCTLELGRLADELLAGRDDVNETLLPQLVALGTDGCPGVTPTVERDECTDAWLPLEASAPVIRHMSTAFFDQHLKGEGDGVQGGVFSGVEVE
jgi:predicted dienelactone hydrolase